MGAVNLSKSSVSRFKSLPATVGGLDKRTQGFLFTVAGERGLSALERRARLEAEDSSTLLSSRNRNKKTLLGN